MFNYPIGGGGKPPAKKPMAKPMAGPATMEPEMGAEDPAQVAAEHGPAQEVHVMHAEGAHHVTSEHPDGHHHESDHGSVEEAHEHAKKLAGAGAEEGAHESEGEDDWND